MSTQRASTSAVAVVFLCCFGCGDLQGGGDTGETCTSDIDCGSGAVCIEGLCSVQTCASDSQCPNGAVCLGGICESMDAQTDLDNVDIDDNPAVDPGDDTPNESATASCAVDADCGTYFGCEQGCVCESGTCVVGGTGLGGNEPPVDDGATDDPVDDTPGDNPPLTGPILDVSSYVLENAEHSPVMQQAVIPEGTLLGPGDLVLIVRGATRSEFEAHFGITLSDSVRYVDASAGNFGAPIVNGGESWVLRDNQGAVVDGATIPGDTGESYQRLVGANPNSDASWATVADTQATPGSTDLNAGMGLVISEWADASGTGNFAFEFVELYYAP